MALLRSSNPTLNDKTFQNIPVAWDRANAMTIDGTVRSEEHTSDSSHIQKSRMPSSA